MKIALTSSLRQAQNDGVKARYMGARNQQDQSFLSGTLNNYFTGRNATDVELFRSMWNGTNAPGPFDPQLTFV